MISNIEKLIIIIGERAKRARHYQECTNSSMCGTYARCQVVVVKFYRDLYFLYRPANVPASCASGIGLI